MEQEVHVATGYMLVQMLVTNWAEAQREDPVLSAVLVLVGSPKENQSKDAFGRACLQ